MSDSDDLLLANEKLRKRIAALNLQLARQAALNEKKIEKLKKKNQFEINKIVGKGKLCKITESEQLSQEGPSNDQKLPPKPLHNLEFFNDIPINIYQNTDEKNHHFSTNDLDDPVLSEFRIAFIEELSKLLTTMPSQRKYSQRFKEMSFCLYHISPQAYRFIRCLLPLPSDIAIYSNFQEEVRNWQNTLIDVKRIPELLQHYRKTNDILEEQNIPVVIGVDACAFDRPTTENHKYSFVFYCQPIIHSYKCFPLHIFAAKDGKANSIINDLKNTISTILGDHNFSVFGFATDGDSGYNVANEGTLDEYLEFLTTNGIEATIEYLTSLETPLSFGDMLHILKLARAKLFSKVPITFSLQNSTFTVSIDKMKNVLDVGKALTDDAPISKMKDVYPIRLFTLKNVELLLNNQCFAEAMYLLPFALWSTAITGIGIHRQTRMELLNFASGIFYSFLLQSHMIEKAEGILYTNRVTANAIFFGDDAFLIRCLNSTIAPSVALKKFADVSLDRVGTHVLENYFGHVRYMCRNYDSYQHILSACAKAIIIEAFAKKYHIQYHVKGRINIGGVNVSANEQATTSYHFQYSSETLAKTYSSLCEFYHFESSGFLCEPISPELFVGELQTLFNTLDYKELQVSEPGSLSSFKIRARCCVQSSQQIVEAEEKRSALTRKLINDINNSTILEEDEIKLLGLKNSDLPILSDMLSHIDEIHRDFTEKQLNCNKFLLQIKEEIDNIEHERSNELIELKARIEQLEESQDLNQHANDLCTPSKNEAVEIHKIIDEKEKAYTDELDQKAKAVDDCLAFKYETEISHLNCLSQLTNSPHYEKLSQIINTRCCQQKYPQFHHLGYALFPNCLLPEKVNQMIRHQFPYIDEDYLLNRAYFTHNDVMNDINEF